MAKKITETGPVGLKGIRNSDLYNSLSTLANNGDADATALLSSLSATKSRPFSSGDNVEGYFTPQQYEEKTPYATLGESQYDEPYIIGSDQTDVNEIRYENQPWYDVLANGVGKMLGKAGTTFLSSLVGLPYGAYQVAKGLVEGQDNPASNLWNNDVTQGLSDIDKWFEENMTNYKSQAQQQDPTFRFGDMNWWADNVITNAGFTLGAAASMAVGAGSLGLLSKALKFTNEVGKTTKGASNFLSALFSATGEGMIEAKQGVEERNKLEFQKLDDEFAPYYNGIAEQQKLADQQYAMTGDYQTYSNQIQDILAQKQELDNRKQAAQQQIEESGKRMGNAILGLNQVLLTAGDLIQFSKGMTKSFDAARHAAETTSKAAKPFGMSAVRVSNDIKDGYKTVGKTFGKTIVAPKNMIKEGSEEMNQQWIQSGASAYYNEKDINDYWKAKLDPEAYSQTTEGLHTLGSALSQGFRESWGDRDQYEQFLIGAMTGAMGSYMPTKIFNQDKTKSRLDPRRYGEWSGGVWQDISEYNQQARQFEENIEDLNKILASEDFPARMRNMTGHTYTETEKTDAAEADDKKAFKDAEDKQFVHDVQAFLRAGKLDDLRAIYNEIGSEITDDDIQNIIKSTTKEISAEEDRQNFDRSIDEQIAAHENRITELQTQAQNIGDSQEGLTGQERADYQTAVTPALEDIFSKIDDEYAAIDNLNQQKQNYVPQKYYEGAYVDRQGNQTVSNDEIKQTIKHNSEELNRKLDSYLDSIAFVNEDTKGALTKDQEDNLAYLHHLGKESLVRADKIISDKRKEMPTKFLMKTEKLPEQLTKEYASSDLVFSKEDDTKEGYVEVDTSLMDDRSFRNFFIGELLWGGNIDPEFSETAEERAAREEEEKNLSDEEKRKRSRERLTKRWKDTLAKRQKDAEEQRDTNGDLIAQHFVTNYRKNNNANQAETQQALNDFFQDIVDASSLVSQSGEYDKTLREYMANPSKVDEDREKAENEAQKANNEQQAKNQFEGKDAKQMNQELASGIMDEDEFFNFANMDLSSDATESLVEAQQEAKKAQAIQQKASALKDHIQNLEADETAKNMAIEMANAAMDNVSNPEDYAIDNPAFSSIPLSMVDPTTSEEDLEDLKNQVQDIFAKGFNGLEEDTNAQDDIPDTAPTGALDGVEMPTTGKDETTKTAPTVKAPSVSSPSKAAQEITPKNPLTEGALDNIIKETSNVTTPQNTNGTWRSTTTRNPYGKSTGTYHETIQDKESVRYKRSKALWDYLNNEHAFDRQENADNDRIKPKDTVHFMVKYLPEVFGSRLEEVSDENKPYALAIIMLNDNGEVIGDLPLAEFEPSFGNNPTQQVRDLKALQDKLFNAFLNHYAKSGGNEAIVDGVLHKEGIDNLNLTFDNAKKSPLMSRVKQVMRGSVPYRKSEKNTLNEVAQGTPELAVKVTATNVGTKRGDKTTHKDIVIPKVGSIGQPYILMPTASGEKIAVPFYMPTFDAEQHRETELYKQLSRALFYMMTTNGNSKENLENFGKHMDVVEGLLQVKRQEGAKRVLDINLNNKTVTLHLQSLTDPNQKIDKTIPYSDNFSEMSKALADTLSGIPINVSLQYLNDDIQTGMGSGMVRRVSYNQVIGEIADVNLPKATKHTVNSWFTVELTTQAGTKPSKAVTPQAGGRINNYVGGRMIEVDTDQLIAYDPQTGEIIEDNEEINLYLAQLKARKPMYKDKDFIQISIGGEVRTYDVKNNKFTKNPSKPASNRRDFVKEIAAAKNTQELISIQQAFTQAQADGTISADDMVKLTSYVNQKRASLSTDASAGVVKFGENNAKADRKAKLKEKAIKKAEKEIGLHPGDIIENEKGKRGVVIEYIWTSIEGENKDMFGHDDVTGEPVIVIDWGGTYEGKKVLERESAGDFYTNWQLRRLHTYKKVSPSKDNKPNGKTIEEIETEAKQKKIVTRQTKDAWAAIPDDLKLKMFNDGAALSLNYRDGYPSYQVSLSDRENLIRILADANMAAKSGKLKVSEAAKPMEKDGVTLSKEKESAARRWLAKNLPSLSSEERTQFVDKLARMGDNAGKAWGSYRSGVIQIQRNAPMGTVYHEAFHYVMGMVLDPEERRMLLDIAKQEYGISDDWAAEERLANDFRRYSLDENATGIVGRIKRWIRKIMDKMNRYNRISDATINQLFWKINNGELAEKSEYVESFEDNQQAVLREIRNIQKENLSWRNLSSDTKAALKDSHLSEAAYNEMSLEEKEQYLRCRG